MSPTNPRRVVYLRLSPILAPLLKRRKNTVPNISEVCFLELVIKSTACNNLGGNHDQDQHKIIESRMGERRYLYLHTSRAFRNVAICPVC